MESLCHIELLLRKSKSTFLLAPTGAAPESHIKRNAVPSRRLPRSRAVVHNHSHRKSTGAFFMSSLPGTSAERQASSACPAPNQSIKRTCLRQAAYVQR